MRKPSPQFLSRVQLRAYYLWLGGAPGDTQAHWLAAETKERELVAKKTASAKKSKARKVQAAGFDVIAGKVMVECPAPRPLH